MSFARAHMLRTLAGRARADQAPVTGGVYDRMLSQLRLHQAHLKTIKSRAAKIAAKAVLLPEFAPYVDGVLASGEGMQDDVLITIMVWRLDAGQWDDALEIAAHALRHNLRMPAPFNRDLATTVLEEIATAALSHLDAGQPVPPDLADALHQAQALTADADLVDEARAKACKALGLIARDSGDIAEAIELLRAAIELDKAIGVKGDLNRLLKQQANAAATAAPPDAPPATEDAGFQAGAGV